MEDSDMDIDISQLNFEEIFFNPLTQQSAWTAMQSIDPREISDDESDNESRKRLRNRKLKTANPTEKVTNAVTTHDTPSSSKDNEKTAATAIPESSSDNNWAPNPGEIMVAELMSRYENGKRQAKQQIKPETQLGSRPSSSAATEVCGSESSELEELSSDGTGKTESSDFIKYCIPQYEQKVKLCNLHFEKIVKMTPKEVGEVCKEIMPELAKIKSQSLPSKRHEIFLECGISKHRLREITVAKPFDNAHDRRVMDLIREVLYHDEDETDNNGEILHYICLVLLPEALIRIFARVNKIDCDLAEKEMRFQAKYDGPLPAYVMKSLPEPE
ncbi:unnamed protein product [Orchesella dallaii]|uniref:Uncharacterized protein n=1 Tax=Orchesella dallaii TaxID=48710 RepID=A0ABP1Q8W7_9HEXA